MRGDRQKLDSTWVVIAAYKEEAALGEVLREVGANFPRVLVVDDGSPDSTARVARDSGALVARHPINRGQGAALQTGLRIALERGAEVIVTFDADGQHRSEDALELVRRLDEAGVDVALGSRFLSKSSNMPLSRRMLLAAAVTFTRAFSGLRLSDTHNGLRAFRRSAAEKLHLEMDRMAHASELLDQIRQHRLPFVEVPVRVRYTPYSMAKGQTSLAALRIVWEYFWGRVLR